MIYAKKMSDQTVIALLVYDYEPEITDASTVIISKDEYDALIAEMKKNEQTMKPERDPDEISDAQALAIITGEVEIDETE